ncbi:MAG: ABC transporter substrate-binding protein [Chloroflexi bacterium]|nr:ABC transporter substrate-binding protein [Chloroflexota bacterium]
MERSGVSHGGSRPNRLSRRQFLRYGGALALTATAALSAACQSTATTPAAPQAKSGAPAKEAAAAKAPAQGGPPSGNLRFWISGGPELETAMKKIFQEYTTDKPNLTITLENFPFTQYFQKLTTAFAGGDAPDMMWLSVWTVEFAKRGAIVPLDQYMTSEYTDDVLPIAFKECDWNGKRWAVPMHELANGLFVNKQVFDQAGIKVPHDLSDAWTWDQVREYSLKLTERSGDATTRWGYGLQRELGDWTVLPILHQNGGQALSPDLKKATGYLNGDASVEAMKWFGGLFTKDKVATPTLPPDAFPTGKVAIIDAVSTYVIPLKNQFADFKYDVAPNMKNKQGAVMTGGWNVGISALSKMQDVSWNLIDFVTRTKHAQWALESGYLPDRKSVIEANPMYKEHPWKLFLDELAQISVHRPPTPEYSFFSDTFGAAVKDIATGADPKATLDKAAATLDPKMANA